MWLVVVRLDSLLLFGDQSFEFVSGFSVCGFVGWVWVVYAELV